MKADSLMGVLWMFGPFFEGAGMVTCWNCSDNEAELLPNKLGYASHFCIQ